jgi:hypothetical protein
MTTEALTQPTLTRPQIETAIAALPPVYRVMLRLLLLRYLDPTTEDMLLMAGERCEPQKRAGGDSATVSGGGVPAPNKVTGIPKEWVVAIEAKVHKFGGLLREQRQQVELQATFLRDYGEGLRRELEAIEHLLRSACDASPETLEELRTQAKLAPVTYTLKKLAVRADKEEIEEEEYLRERLSLEYQAHARRFERAKKRLNQILLERRAMLAASLSDEFLATIWCIAKGPIMDRRVKAVQRYITALATSGKGRLEERDWTAAVTAGLGPRLAGGSNNEGIGSKPGADPGDLWALTLSTLAGEPMPPIIPKPCGHHAGGKALAGKFRSMATYVIGEEEDVKVWELTAQCLHCLMLLRALQLESGVIADTSETVLARITARTALPRKESPETAAQKAPEPPEEQSEYVALILRNFIGADAGQAGAKSWW